MRSLDPVCRVACQLGLDLNLSLMIYIFGIPCVKNYPQPRLLEKPPYYYVMAQIARGTPKPQLAAVMQQ